MKYPSISHQNSSGNLDDYKETLVVNKKLTCSQYNSKYLTGMSISLVGGILGGGPIGLLLIHLFHMGIQLSVVTEIATIIMGFTTTNIIRKKYRGSKEIVRVNESLVRDESRVILSANSYHLLKLAFLEADTEIALQSFTSLLEDDPWLKKWYNGLLITYYKRKMSFINKYNSNNIREIKLTLGDMINDLVGMLFPANNDSIDTETATLLYCLAERILMMSLYRELYENARFVRHSQDKCFLKNKGKINSEVIINDDIITCLNSLVTKKTATQKVSVLIKVCELINNDTNICCDTLLLSFVNHLAKSDIKYPFSELIVIETLLPDGLIGKESYVIATFLASCHYIANLS